MSSARSPSSTTTISSRNSGGTFCRRTSVSGAGKILYSGQLTAPLAISNGITAFKQPASRNAGRTLTWMVAILATFFIGTSYLARHYGIPNITGSQFRRIELTPEFDVRRGLLGKGAILTATSYANRTSPVQRGKWVLINVFGMQPPTPPPNVPQLKSDSQTGVVQIQTMRDQMEQHRANPACASCHRMMDPMGFALENFDPTGQWRTQEPGGAVDATGQLEMADGPF